MLVRMKKCRKRHQACLNNRNYEFTRISKRLEDDAQQGQTRAIVLAWCGLVEYKPVMIQ